MGKINDKKMNKKGIFFTFIAITIMAIFILIFTPPADISLQKDLQAVKARIGSVDNYVNDLENGYFETVLRATTHKAILSLVFYINSTGNYLTDLDSAFYEVALNGTLKGIPIDSITGKKIMDNNTLTNWTNRIIITSKDTLNVNTTISIKGISVYQTKPWNIDSSLSLNFAVNSNVAQWSKDVVITATIPIEGLHDPSYLVNTRGEYTNQIKKSDVLFNQWNITKVREHLRNGTYVYWSDSNAPNFLMRFTNTTTNSSCCGIKSFVNPNKIVISDQSESYLDYLFWAHIYNNPANCTQLYNITNPSTGGGLWDEFRYFKLDINHLVLYNITPQDAVRNC